MALGLCTNYKEYPTSFPIILQSLVKQINIKKLREMPHLSRSGRNHPDLGYNSSVTLVQTFYTTTQHNTRRYKPVTDQN